MIVATDPPYYDNIGYAETPDFFYLWQRRTLLSGPLRTVPAGVVSPKQEELVATPYRHGGKELAEKYFLDGMKKALSGLAHATASVPVTIYYAYKQQENVDDGQTSAGWSTFLQALTDCELAVDGTWPMRTEGSGRIVAKETNALASSIILVCRRRDVSAGASPCALISFAPYAAKCRTPSTKSAPLASAPRTFNRQPSAPASAFLPAMAASNPDGSAMLVKDALKLINQVREEIAPPPRCRR